MFTHNVTSGMLHIPSIIQPPVAHHSKGCCEILHACEWSSFWCIICTSANVAAVVLYVISKTQIHPATEMPPADVLGIGLPNGQETHLPVLCLLWILDVFPFDLQGICHLGGEAVLSPSVNVPSIFQVSLQIPFGEIRKHFMEEPAFISRSAPTGICNFIMAFIIFYLYCSCVPSVSSST